MEFFLRQIAEFVGGTLFGNGEIVIKGVAGIKEAKEGEITFLANPKYLSFLETTQASAVLIAKTAPVPKDKSVIVCDNPSFAFSKIIERFNPLEIFLPKGIHPTAVLGKDVVLGSQVSIGPHAVIEDGAEIGDKTVIGALSYIGVRTKVGSGTIIHPNVTVRELCIIGDRVIIHSGTVIGSDGFGYETVDGVHHKIPQVGIVVLGDDVEIGANVTIDRARFGKTLIQKGTKIDNLVQIAHNVEIGEHCLIVAQVGISGTTKVGNRVILAGQVGLVGHIEVGDNVVVAAQSGVSKSLPGQAAYGGSPAIPINEWKKNLILSLQIGKWVERIKDLGKRVKELENQKK